MTDHEFVTEYLIENKMTISFMESCTSGLLASMFTDTPGASSVFKGSLVTYSNEAKVAAGVSADIIEKHGVYSKECASNMAEVIKQKYDVDIAVGITGTTGNIDTDNASSSVPGEAYYCLIVRGEIYNYHISINAENLSRRQIKQFYANEVYKSLSEILNKK